MNIKKLSFITLITCSIILTGCNKSNDVNQKIVEDKAKQDIEKKEIVKNEVDYSDSFNGINGCAVFYNSTKEVYNLYNPNLCEEQISPYSTFKIMGTLMGLSKGIVESEKSTMGYDQTKYSKDVWNQDITLEDAFKESCVWYYKKIIASLDKEYVLETLKDLKYGNCDISAWDENGHNGFWLSSSLKISPIQQIEVLNKIFEGNSNFKQEDIELLKKIMLVQENENFSVYGKTGSASEQNAWFVGFFEKNQEKIYFAVRIDDKTQKLAGSVAKNIAIDIINKYY